LLRSTIVAIVVAGILLDRRVQQRQTSRLGRLKKWLRISDY
jgi:hypothetical protein